MIRQRAVLALAAGLASTLLMAACDSANDVSSTSPGSTAPVAPASSEPAAPSPATSATTGGGTSGSGDPAVATMLTARAMKGLGSVVTDDKGMTLYRYDKDESNPSKWTCSGACTKTWIPVIVQDVVRTSGVEKSLLGTVHRDGRPQLTLGGWPLYRYVGDTEAGQINGQGKDAQWYAVTPSGQKATPSG
ncbi:hypothetical protein [Streptomyces sp. NBC_00358]|uniref:hypothetical protein n=1 Tax=Streptomyces sp. NBC_00358 TaxID=2975725 RepID=UPI002E270C74